MLKQGGKQTNPKALTHTVDIKTRPLKHLPKSYLSKMLLLQQMKRWLRIIMRFCALTDLGYQFTTYPRNFWQQFCEHCQSDLQLNVHSD